MKIETVPLDQDAAGNGMHMLVVTGAWDAQHPVVKRARELAVATGSPAFLASFDASLAEQVAAAA